MPFKEITSACHCAIVIPTERSDEGSLFHYNRKYFVNPHLLATEPLRFHAYNFANLKRKKSLSLTPQNYILKAFFRDSVAESNKVKNLALLILYSAAVINLYCSLGLFFKSCYHVLLAPKRTKRPGTKFTSRIKLCLRVASNILRSFYSCRCCLNAANKGMG